MPEIVGILLGTAIPLVVGGFLAGLFTYAFERRLRRIDRQERRRALLESLRRELAFVPVELPAYQSGAVYFLPPIRLVVGSHLLDGQALDWKSDEPIIQAVLEFMGLGAIYNELVATINSGQALSGWTEEGRRHWHGQLLGAHASLLSVQQKLLEAISGAARVELVEQLGEITAEGLRDASDASWTIDSAHSSVRFSAKHMGVMDVHGRFTRARVLLDLNQTDVLQSAVEVLIDASSVSTDDSRRDADLRSDHFLDAERYPHLTFVSTGLERINPRQLRLVGDLTIRDLTRPLTLLVTESGQARGPRGLVHAGFHAETVIDRRDWGLTWNVPLETGGWLVSDEIAIVVEVEATKRPLENAVA